MEENGGMEQDGKYISWHYVCIRLCINKAKGMNEL